MSRCSALVFLRRARTRGACKSTPSETVLSMLMVARPLQMTDRRKAWAAEQYAYKLKE